MVSESDKGEVIAWDLDVPARRKSDGSWVFGATAAPSADELKDRFSRVMDSKRATMLDHDARAAASVK